MTTLLSQTDAYMRSFEATVTARKVWDEGLGSLTVDRDHVITRFL